MRTGREVIALEGLSREEWLRARKQGIGSSDVAAVLGLDPWKGPFDVWAEKCDPEVRDDGASPIMRLGQLLEDGIAQAYAETTGSHIDKPGFMYAHERHDWMLANPDRFTDNSGPGLLEVKLAGNAARWEEGPPEQYQLQCLHQMAVTGDDYADLAVLLYGRDLRIFRVERDDVTIEHLISIERDFWQQVQDRVAPEADHLSTDALRRVFRESHPDAIELDPAMARVVEEYREAKAALKALEERTQGLRNRLAASLGEYQVGTIDGRKVVSWTPQVTTSYDYDALDTDYPGLREQYAKGRTIRVLRLPRSKK